MDSWKTEREGGEIEIRKPLWYCNFPSETTVVEKKSLQDINPAGNGGEGGQTRAGDPL